MLVWNFSEVENTIFFEPKSWWNDEIYWLKKRFCFKYFGGGKYGLFLSQKVDVKMIFTDYWKFLVLNFLEIGNTVFSWAKKVDGKMIFTWSFWAFHDIPGLGKYGFSCSDRNSYSEVFCRSISLIKKNPFWSAAFLDGKW